MTDIVCISPVDGRELARRRSAGSAEVATVLAEARAAQAEWAQRPLAERIELVMTFVEALIAMNEAIVPELAWQMGRPVRYDGEARGVEERSRHMAALAEGALASVVPAGKAGYSRFIERVPLGIVLVIAPWNYPYLTAINTIVPALIAGNAVLLKVASQSLLCGDRFQAAAEKAGLPAGIFRNIVLDHETTARLVSTGAVDHVNFTGSVAAGRTVARAAGEAMITVGLELGGKDPAYVRADAAFDATIEALVDGAFFNSGQCCCGVERIYVHDALYDRFVDAFVAATATYRLGDPLDPATTLGPMAHARFADLVRQQTAEAIAAGATPCLDPARFPGGRMTGPYLAPQVLIGVDHSMSVMLEESFGPVVGIMRVKSDEAAVALMNDSPFGLTASIWSADATAARQIGKRLATGTVYLNRCDYLDPDLAWTGVKDSGRGVSLSPLGYAALTRPKSFHLRH